MTIGSLRKSSWKILYALSILWLGWALGDWLGSLGARAVVGQVSKPVQVQPLTPAIIPPAQIATKPPTDRLRQVNPKAYEAYAFQFKMGGHPTTQPTVQDVFFADRVVIAAEQNQNAQFLAGPRQVIADAQYWGYPGPGVDGRCLVLMNAPWTTGWNLEFRAGNDDPLGPVGDCHGSVFANCIFPCERWGEKALIGYTNPDYSNRAGPYYGADAGYASTFVRCQFKGGAIRLVGGVWRFIDCDFTIGALYAIDLMDAQCDFINCRWWSIKQPDWAKDHYWYDPVYSGCPIRVVALVADPTGNNVQGWPGSDPKQECRLWFNSTCMLDGKPAGGRELCRLWPDAKSAKAGHIAYQGVGSVPARVFLKTPNW